MIKEVPLANDQRMVKDVNNDKLNKVKINGEDFFEITDVDKMRPFLMSIVSDSDHWMFIGSNGALSAGRRNSDYALFPYYTDDKIIESLELTGSKTLVRIHQNGSVKVWEPFSIRTENNFELSRNLYKNVYGNKVLFEEINHSLGLTFSYEWNSSDQYGFIRKTKLQNTGSAQLGIAILDGLQNIMPYGVGENLQVQRSNLVDAYKRNELAAEVGLGIYALSAIIVDKAEPSEALKANVVWHSGLPEPKYLVSSLQVEEFRASGNVDQEVDVKAEKGAFFVNSEFVMDPNATQSWFIAADVNKDQSQIAKLMRTLEQKEGLLNAIDKDIELGTENLNRLVASSDGIQYSADRLRDTRHYANTLFNIMRGGIFDNSYQIELWDFKDYLKKANREVFNKNRDFVNSLGEQFAIQNLIEKCTVLNDQDLKRLCYEYLPLKFSRRHGDPSRPWNRFSINTRNEIDGSKVLDYEGNWRDIFQNWEALAHSYPPFVEGMIHKFLNATTFDGYNPYRVTKDGFDWEVIEEHDPWSYIGYWGDHQIIYLLKFLEIINDRYPNKLHNFFNEDIFVYANVPYKIKEYADLLKNPKDTIVFDHELDLKIRSDRDGLGADGALLRNQQNQIHRVNFIEKILATVLAKVSNFIIEGGIWMNTQRPEWNDANNALVGNGVSMVTLCYLRRFVKFLDNILDASKVSKVDISEELVNCFNSISQTLETNLNLLQESISNEARKQVLSDLGESASEYRERIYGKNFSGIKIDLNIDDISNFSKTLLRYLDHSISANERSDGMYHAYNLMSVDGDSVSIDYLEEMLEGQVAVLSSGYLSSQEALHVLNSLKSSALFRPDQYSYLLYPNKTLPGFLERNVVEESDVKSSKLLTQLIEDGDQTVLNKDVFGKYHFNGNFNNASDLSKSLENLSESKYGSLIREERQHVLDIFEKVFNHKAFTGRSGTFYGYEGLGSIYWHMVSKLLLATQECCLKAIRDGESDEVIGKLLEHYYEINEGIGVHKSPSLYGAFPTDPYSHTPFTKGAQQPGMTGQVKEDILSRIGELGVFVKEGKVHFNPCLLRQNEFIQETKTFNYIDVSGSRSELLLEPQTMAFTYCQVPVVYKVTTKDSIEVVLTDGTNKELDGHILDLENSNYLFNRTGLLSHVVVNINNSKLK